MENIWARYLSLDEVLPCVGQAAIGIECRADDQHALQLLDRLNHAETLACVTAERAFLEAMGGGCQSPVAAHATIQGDNISMKVVSYRNNLASRGEASRPLGEEVELGKQLAAAVQTI